MSRSGRIRYIRSIAAMTSTAVRPRLAGGWEVAMQLNVVEGFDVGELGHNSAEALHLVVESIKLAKADVYRFVADPATTDVPVAGLLSETICLGRDVPRSIRPRRWRSRHPAHLRALSTRSRASVPSSVRPDRAYPGSTSSFSVADRYGNVVVSTPTLGSEWGTGVSIGDTGIVFNNGTRHGSTSPYPDHVNYARGGQIPVLNNAPTIVMKDGAFFVALGTPGGETIGQTQFQVLLNIIDYGMGIQQAIGGTPYRAGRRTDLLSPWSRRDSSD